MASLLGTERPSLASKQSSTSNDQMRELLYALYQVCKERIAEGSAEAKAMQSAAFERVFSKEARDL